MSYIKVTTYGDYVEINEYEHDLIRNHDGRAGRRSSAISNDNLGASGEDSLSERDTSNEVGRRSDNAWRASMAFRRLVSANLGRGSAPPLLATLTYRSNFTELSAAYKHFTTFAQSLRRKFGNEFKYLCVPEFQKRGAVHFHAFFWGLPEEVFLLERKNRTLAQIWSHGFVDLKRTDGAGALAGYLAKYLTKAYEDPRLKNQKAYVASRNIIRPEVFAGNFSADRILFELGVNSDPEISREYNTKWFGRATYRKYKINHDEPQAS